MPRKKMVNILLRSEDLEGSQFVWPDRIVPLARDFEFIPDKY